MPPVFLSCQPPLTSSGTSPFAFEAWACVSSENSRPWMLIWSLEGGENLRTGMAMCLRGRRKSRRESWEGMQSVEEIYYDPQSLWRCTENGAILLQHELHSRFAPTSGKWRRPRLPFSLGLCGASLEGLVTLATNSATCCTLQWLPYPRSTQKGCRLSLPSVRSKLCPCP